MDNNSFSTKPVESSTTNIESTSHPNKLHSRMRPAIAGAIGAITGLTVGAVGIFGLIKLTNKPPKCLECNCERQAATGDLNYDFLKLESASANIIYSPLSIRNGLELLRTGANGDTKTEIDKVLGDTEVPKYENIPDTLSLANAVFIRDSFKDKVLPDYTSTIQEKYNGETIYDDFSNTNNMDNWVKQKTFNLIDGMGIQLTPETEMVLSNALAIQMDWKEPFDASDTRGESFYLKDDSEVQATTMHKETTNENTKYYTDENVTAVSMQLDSKTDNVNLDFVAIMPSGNIDEYINNINQSEVDGILEKLTPASEPKDGLVINIPKFKFDYSLNFRDDLKKLGINTAFDKEKADFSNMASDPLFVGEAIHRANIDFAEEGVKAAAITVFAMMDASAIVDEPQPVVINFDHPFLFLIRDNSSGAVWFTGAVYQPNLWENDSADYEPTY